MDELNFGAQLMTLPQIFRNRFFTVPDYQRGYAWDVRQVEELLKDLDHLIDDGVEHRHYTGTLVLSRAADSTSDFHVVDGQQRLTTVVIAMRLLGGHLLADDQANMSTLYVRRGNSGAERTVLQLNSDTRQYFERVVLGSGHSDAEPATLEAHGRLLVARKLINEWMIRRLESGTTALQLRSTFESEMGFLVYAPSEDAETGIMFEVINNRGKPLSELEKVKNYLIYCCVKLSAPTLRKDIDDDWSRILRNLNIAGKTAPADEGGFLRYCMVVHFGLNKTDSQYGYDELKKRLELDSSIREANRRGAVVSAIKDFVHFMKSAALWYARLYGRNHDGLDGSLIALLDKIRAQDRHASIMPLFLALVIKNDERGANLLRLLDLLEKLNFRVYMARNITKRNDSGQGYLYDYAANYYSKKLLESIPDEERTLPKSPIVDDHQALEYRLVEFVLDFAPDSIFDSSFRLELESNDDFYKWGGLRYFLMSYEQQLQPNKTIQIDKITMSRSEGKSGDYLSVEHRWAEKNRNGEGENNRKIDSFERRRLGNFVLLELRPNIIGSNEDIEQKIKLYVEGVGDEPPTDLQQVRRMVTDTRSVLNDLKDRTRSKNYYLDLNRIINDRVESRLARFALKRWSIGDYLGYKELKKRAELDSIEDPQQ